MNRPVTPDRIIAPCDTTGDHACPIWMRITAMQIATPFRYDPSQMPTVETLDEVCYDTELLNTEEQC